jgi:hypothetical protein
MSEGFITSDDNEENHHGFSFFSLTPAVNNETICIPRDVVLHPAGKSRGQG